MRLYNKQKSLNDGDIISLNEGALVSLNGKNPVGVIPESIYLDKNSKRNTLLSYSVVSDVNLMNSAMAEIKARHILGFKAAMTFSQKVFATARTLEPFSPYFAKEGNAPCIKMVNNRGEHKMVNLIELARNEKLIKKIDWRATAKLYKGKDPVVYMQKAYKENKKKGLAGLYDISFPTQFTVKVRATGDQVLSASQHMMKNHPEEYSRFVMEVKPAKYRRPQKRERIRALEKPSRIRGGEW